jgi:hypothetical protein
MTIPFCNKPSKPPSTFSSSPSVPAIDPGVFFPGPALPRPCPSFPPPRLALPPRALAHKHAPIAPVRPASGGAACARHQAVPVLCTLTGEEDALLLARESLAVRLAACRHPARCLRLWPGGAGAVQCSAPVGSRGVKPSSQQLARSRGRIATGAERISHSAARQRAMRAADSTARPLSP